MNNPTHLETQLIPIRETLEENQDFVNNPDCQDSLQACIDYYKVVGFSPPWICYYGSENGHLVGSAGIKGRPVNNQIEIAYGTFERYQQQGVGTRICRMLVELSLRTDPRVIITARTMPEANFSTKILEKNNFELLGTVVDQDDGEVWGWKYLGNQ